MHLYSKFVPRDNRRFLWGYIPLANGHIYGYGTIPPESLQRVGEYTSREVLHSVSRALGATLGGLWCGYSPNSDGRQIRESAGYQHLSSDWDLFRIVQEFPLFALRREDYQIPSGLVDKVDLTAVVSRNPIRGPTQGSLLSLLAENPQQKYFLQIGGLPRSTFSPLESSHPSPIWTF